ncbi:MAG: DUF4838 domain-containing protein [Clostridia bacterium]|nr:DUF4838 domain-containing protein [Clostridia bacterium]
MKSIMILHPEELSKAWIDQIADAGITTLGLHPVGGRNAAKALNGLVEALQTPEYKALLDYAAERGLEIEYELHAAGYLMPRDHFDAHPEYFRMNEKGERVTDWNFCVSNPDALSLVTQRAVKLATSLYRSNKRFHFWMDDGRNIHCHCPKCQALSPSDQQLLVMNAMLRQIRDEIPDAQMAYLAYIDSIVLPETVQPEEGIYLEYAPFEKYTAKTEDAPMLIARELAMLRPLMERFGQKDSMVLEYWYDNSLFSHWQKPAKKFVLDRDGLEQDIRDYRALGFPTVATFGCYLGADYRELYGEVDVTPFAKAVHTEVL